MHYPWPAVKPFGPLAGIRGPCYPDAVGRTIDIDYKNGLPAWRLKIVQPERFRAVEVRLATRAFKMPQGALLGVLLKLYDVPDQPYFAHRIMDLSDERVARHARLCADEGRILLVFERVAQQAGFDRTLELDRDRWRSILEEGSRHNAAVAVDPDEALEAFLAVFEPASRAGGIEAGWAAVDRMLARR